MLTQCRPTAGLLNASATRAASKRYFWCTLALAATVSLAAPRAMRASDFVAPTPQELAMTSLPDYPGVPAVVLFKEEITRDDLHSVQRHYRIKILTEEGKKYANVELSYFSSTGSYWGTGDDKSVEGISGRTIHPDGTIIPFTGKPYLKVVAKADGFKVQEKVFTLPDVTVGSIIEYRYDTRINDHVFESPTWLIQEDLYVKEAHFTWWPTGDPLVDEDQKPITSISWFPILPEGAKIESHQIPGNMLKNSQWFYDLRVKDVPPTLKEEYMPPISSFTYRVYFNFTPYRTPQEYWTAEGKRWSKDINAYISPNDSLSKQTQEIISKAATSEDKLRSIYAAVMKLENTDFTRERDSREDKAAGVRKISNASDIFASGRGSRTELTELFIAMAKAAGFTAYAMDVPDRSQTLFVPQRLSMRQFDDLIAVVNVDGKEQFFDPGSRYCPYGQLAWQHTLVQGLRQVDGGTAFGMTPSEAFKQNRTTRVANLTMDARGEVTGKVDLSFTGAPALHWRQVALRGDDESLRKELREHAERMLPRTLEIEVADIKDLTGYEKPLGVSYQVKGTIGSPAGKRLMMPADLFLVNKSATFPHEKRSTAVYFEYPQITQDAVRVNLPPSLAVEAVPTPATYSMPKVASYAITIAQAPTNVTTRRDFVFGDFFVLAPAYPSLRTFYSQMESKDQENIVLKAGPSTTAANTGEPAKE